ncbi:MAG: hypothetical protein F6K53_41770 [Moorea sp. SIO4A1]|uniref:hypothetical protein n=1 Tax=Moorena sp. SIO4A1 TaxID=2607835 RepID=UPI001418A490|nr:hypothetical protein [Moorena sp. SIO4A1]NEO45244.1 hypothetical protein [Moorena sp. SIO4A3]NEQ63496.1 hypothetical protein [Moorena sp. SIO4A1]
MKPRYIKTKIYQINSFGGIILGEQVSLDLLGALAVGEFNSPQVAPLNPTAAHLSLLYSSLSLVVE